MTDLTRETTADRKYNLLETDPWDADVNMPKFKERKTTQVAALLAQSRGGKIDLYNLVKLIYLIDREALKRWGRPVTYDRPFNLPLGPTPSATYDLVRNPSKGKDWPLSFSAPHHNVIKLISPDAENDELSQAEIDLIQEVFREFGHKNFGELKRYVHDLPEFRDPGKSSEPIRWDTLLRAVGWKGEDLAEIKRDLEASAKFEKLIG